jgi:putative Mg2+ transporter-C (MgtC) family protein
VGWRSRADIGASVEAARSECQLRAFLNQQPWHAVENPHIQTVFSSGVICVRGVCYTAARRLPGAAERSLAMRSREYPSEGEEGWMPLTLTWHEIALRLALSVVAGTLIGLDRGERGRPAGLRTTLLVCLAASVAMIQANLLLATTGKASDSFITLDLMRLPLGILTGMGFIGAGAVLRRDGLVFGVTTAATLWFVTVIGLCFGGGQIALGLAGLFLGLIVVSALRWIEFRMTQDQHATLSLTTERDRPTQQEIYGTVQQAGFKIKVSSVAYINQSQQRQFEFLLQWRVSSQKMDVPAFVRELSSDPSVFTAQWKVS